MGHCIHGLGIGGAQQVVRLIAQVTTPQGFRHVVYSPEGGVLQPALEAADILCRIVPRCMPKFDPLWVARLAQAFRRDRIDVVHTHLFGDSLHGYLAAAWPGRLPVIMTLHSGAEAHTRLQQRGYRWLLRRTAQNVACSPSVQRYFEGLAAPQSIGIVTIPNGVQPPSATSRVDVRVLLGLPSTSFVVGAVGRLAPEKGYDLLLDAFATVIESGTPDIRLVLVGDGPLRAELSAHADRLGIGRKVVFAGFRADAAQIIGAFDIVVFSSLFEGLPIALLEAMAASRCIVATRAAGILDALEPDREALVVPVRDVSGLAHALSQALLDAGLRARLGAAARARFIQQFTADEMAGRYATLYRNLWKRAHRAPSSSRRHVHAGRFL